MGLGRNRSDRLVGLSCPECFGTLSLRTEGPRGHLTFLCRIGHAFAVPELLAAKEEVLERWLWAALLSLEELRALLTGLTGLADGQAMGSTASAFRERAERARDQAQSLRAIIEQNRAVEVTQEAARLADDGGSW
jgi:hypothetical protein